MKTYFVAFLSLILFSCHFDPTIDYRIDPILKPYVDKFFQEAEKRNKYYPKQNLIMDLYKGLQEKGAWGRSTNYGKQRVIFIDYDHFYFNHDNGYPFRNEATIFHELGHTILGRSHTQERSIMNIDKCFSDYCYDGDSTLIDELFYGS